MSTTDRIEKNVTLRAPVSRVWRALTDHKEFSAWFGITLEGPFVVGKQTRGTFGDWMTVEMLEGALKEKKLPPMKVALPPKNAVFCTVERMEPERAFAFRWIPFGVDEGLDHAAAQTTLVEFTLEPKGNETLLKIVESGFDRVPAYRREHAFRMNEGGWSGQADNIKRHVEA